MWTRRTRFFENLEFANRTATFRGKCGEGSDPYHSRAPWISPGPIREPPPPPLSLSSSVFEISFVISVGKEQHPVLVPRARNYNAAPPIAVKEEPSLSALYIYLLCLGVRDRRKCRKGRDKSISYRHVCDRVYGSRERSADAL